MHASLVCVPRGAQAPELVEICRCQQNSLGRSTEVGHRTWQRFRRLNPAVADLCESRRKVASSS